MIPEHYLGEDLWLCNSLVSHGANYDMTSNKMAVETNKFF